MINNVNSFNIRKNNPEMNAEMDSILKDFVDAAASNDSEGIDNSLERFRLAIIKYGIKEIITDRSNIYRRLVLDKKYPILHKLIKMEWVRDDIENNHIRCSRPDTLNDPFECTIPMGDIQLPGINKSVLETILARANRDLEHRRSSIHVGSFTESISRPMWAYYGDNGKGVSIDLDMSKLKGQHLLGQVIYSDKMNEVADVSSMSEALAILSGLYCYIKHTSWKHEREWRLINDQEFLDITDCIVSITLGYNVDMNDEKTMSLLQSCKKRNIPVKQTKLEGFELIYELISN